MNDSEQGILYLYCDTTNTPTAINTDCTGGTTSGIYPYNLTCTFATPVTDTSYIEYCRIYDGALYSNVSNWTYTTDSTVPTTSVTSVAGDIAASYFDTINDGQTEINISGENNMSCRWSGSDVAYSSMSNDCLIYNSVGQCIINDVLTQGLTTRYISCQDNLTNEQNSTQNLNVIFTLDYTSPTTTDNSNVNIQVPNYTVTITEVDNFDGDPTTYYCTTQLGICTPTILIDNGGTVVYTNSSRGANNLSYYSVDDSGNVQGVVNKTININQLPVFTSASDNSSTIGSGWLINITSVSYDPDSSQNITMYICNSSNANAEGCNDTEYCNITLSGNVSDAGNATCTFTAESVSGTYTWYAFLYDESEEIAITNQSGSYTVDATKPVITISSPTNTTYTQDSVTASNELKIVNWKNIDYSDVLIYSDAINKHIDKIYLIGDSIELEKKRLRQNLGNGLLVSNNTLDLLNKSSIAFSNDQLNEAENLLNEYKLSLENDFAQQSTLTSLENNTKNFFQRYWLHSLIIVAFILGISLFMIGKYKIQKLEHKVLRMKHEKEILKSLIKKTQDERFIKGSISNLVYNVRMSKYNEKLDEIKQQLPVLEEKLKKNSFVKNKKLKK